MVYTYSRKVTAELTCNICASLKGRIPTLCLKAATQADGQILEVTVYLSDPGPVKNTEATAMKDRQTDRKKRREKERKGKKR